MTKLVKCQQYEGGELYVDPERVISVADLPPFVDDSHDPPMEVGHRVELTLENEAVYLIEGYAVEFVQQVLCNE